MSAASAPGGVIVPLTTPFTADGDIEQAAFRRQVAHYAAHGVGGVVVGGSTGEGYALEEAELVLLTEAALDAAAGRVPVLAGILADSTRAAVRRAEALSRLPIAGLLVAPPHYIFSPDADGQELFFGTVASAAGVPVIIYNVVPWCTVRPATAESIMRRAPGVIAIKQSDTDFGTYATLVRSVGAERVFAAIDAALMSCYELGAAGSIAAIGTAAPAAGVQLWRAVRAGDRGRAVALHEGLVSLWSALAGPNLPARVKAAQGVQGLEPGFPRSPMAPPSPEETQEIAAALAGLSRLTDGRSAFGARDLQIV